MAGTSAQRKWPLTPVVSPTKVSSNAKLLRCEDAPSGPSNSIILEQLSQQKGGLFSAAIGFVEKIFNSPRKEMQSVGEEGINLQPGGEGDTQLLGGGNQQSAAGHPIHYV